MTTLTVLDAFRYTHDREQMETLKQASEFLLAHWEIRQPISPCHYGMGTLFMQTEYPFRGYNLFIICMSCLFILLPEKTHDFGGFAAV